MEDVADITETQLKPVLECIRQGQRLPDTALHRLEAVRQTLRREGLAPTPANLDWALSRLLTGLVEAGLAFERGVPTPRGAADRAQIERGLADDFRADNTDREGWSSVYHRYLIQQPLQVKHIAAIALPGQKSGARQLNRRIAHGIELLARAILVRESESSAAVERSASPGLAALVPDRLSKLPLRRNSFVGREAAVAELARLLADSPLVTLVGPGGVGKTRLALRVASDLAAHYSDGVWLVDLSRIEDGSLVAPAVSDVLDVVATASQSSQNALIGRLQSRRLLLVLDNCEQVVAACAELAMGLLAACPGLSILATSRWPLHVEGEREWQVPTLTVPSASARDPEHIASYEAVRLFVDRAAAVRPGFALDASNAAAIAAICRRLDGIPLAIELAAARTRMLPPAVILRQLDDPATSLGGGWRSAPPRQQTLDDAIDWSYHLLTETEKALLARLAVFRGGWSLEAAQAVGNGGLVEASNAVEILHSLVDKSLVVAVLFQDDARYHYLETIRGYAGRRLEASGERAALRRAHADHFVALAERAEPGLKGPDQAQWLDRLELESDNFRAVFDWAEADADPAAVELGLRLGAALWLFWYTRGYVQEDPMAEDGASSPYRIHARNYLTEGRAYLSWLLDHTGPDVPPAVRANALHAAGTLATYQSDYPTAQDLLSQGLAIRREIGDDLGCAKSLNNLAGVALLQSDFASARDLYEQSLAITREQGNLWDVEVGLDNLAEVAKSQGDDATARGLFEESLGIARAIGDHAGMARALGQLGTIAHNQGDLVLAQSYYDQSLRIYLSLGDRRAVAQAQSDIGQLALDQGLYFTARTMFEDCLRAHRELNDAWSTGRTLAYLGIVHIYEGQLSAAYTQLAEALAQSEQVGDLHHVGVNLHYLCRIHCRVGELQEARRRLHEGLGIYLMGNAHRGHRNQLSVSVAALAAAEERHASALMLAAAVEAARTAGGPPMPPAEYSDLELTVAAARQALDAGVAAAAWERGTELTVAKALEAVLRELGGDPADQGTQTSPTS